MLLGIVMILAFTLVHAVYWSDMRMRAPLMPTLYLAAALALIPRAWKTVVPMATSLPANHKISCG
jgi:hypothetical protein